MQKHEKKAAIAILFILLLTTSAAIVLVPDVNAHSPGWYMPSWAYIVPSPNPVGVGQKVAIVMWVDTPLPSASIQNDIRRHDYSLTITKPNGEKISENWPIVSDTTSIQYYQFTPDQVGNYTLYFEYKGQNYTWSGTYQNDVYMATNKTAVLMVQEEQLPSPLSSYPLPTEYWTRPIEGQNTDWWSISSNWLGAPYIEGGSGVAGAVQPDGIAPNSPHVMWAKPIQDGGVVGGDLYNPIGKTYYMGGSYNVRFSNALIMYGRLFYDEPYGNSGSGGSWLAVDLRTGQEIWRTNTTGIGSPSFGYLYSYDTGNQHGVLPDGLLFTSNFARSYDPSTGIPTTMNVTNVPSGTACAGPQGEILRYSVTNAGNSSAPDWRLTQWNSSNVIGGGTGMSPSNWYSGNIPANCPITPKAPDTTNIYWNGTTYVNSATRSAQGWVSVTTPAYDWNVSITLGAGSWSINRLAYQNIMLLTQGSFGARGSWDGANVTALNLNSTTGQVGKVLWTKYYPAAPGNVSRSIVAWDPANNVFIMEDKETMVHYGFSLLDGSQIWGPTPPANDYNYFRQNTYCAYGNMYFGGYGGELYCYDDKTGDLIWSYGGGGEGNSTKSGLTTAWGSYPIFIDVIADHKIYLAGTEHSPDSPFYKGTRYRCINATDGTEIWTLLGWGTGMDANYDRIADGYFVFLNCYDMRVYSVGKGPSAMTLDAPMNSPTLGNSVTIRGTILDIAAGTKQTEQAARFPYGVPAVSDESMGPWMEYVYMQKPRPTNATGVPITLSVVDANGNYREIGQTTSDADGFFSYNWKPDIEGKYTVHASFGGSESFWPSHAVTAFSVDPASASASPASTPQPSVADTYFVPAIAGLFVAIVVVGILTMLMVRKRP